MDFDSLLSYCLKLNESSCDKCLICHIPIENTDEHLKLKCTHLFHKKCIGYKSGTLKCLYCEKISIPEIINGSEKINSNITPKLDINKQKDVCCKVVLKTGPNKGQYCNRENCKYHKLQVTQLVVFNPDGTKKPKSKLKQNKPIIKKNICTIILKSGVKSGQACGRDLPCKYHHKIVNIQSNQNILKQTELSENNFNNELELLNEDDEDLIEV